MATRQGHHEDGSFAYGAREALQDVDTTRARLGHRLIPPWWYKLVSASIVAALFVGSGMPYESLSFGSATTGASLLVLTLVIGPLGLREVLKRTTGASFDRYLNGWSVPSLMLVSLLLLSALLQNVAGIEPAPLIGAAVGFAFTCLYERRIDLRLARGQFPADATREKS